jgi:beta-phosphoglucomutase family hydrolase
MLGLPDSIQVALFDLDGVLTSTAVLHRKAWKQAFDSYLAKRDPEGYEPFTDNDYLRYVDGRPRVDGVRTFLASRHIDADEVTVEAIGTGKNDLFRAAVARGEVEPYPGSVRYLEAVEKAGLQIGVVTSSKNGAEVLDAADLSHFVQVRIDGLDITRRGLRGKPAPDSFLAAAKAFGVEPQYAAVYEDAISGIEAGRAGGFGCVVAVDRVGTPEHAAAMRSAGADVVVTDLAGLLDR